MTSFIHICEAFGPTNHILRNLLSMIYMPVRLFLLLKAPHESKNDLHSMHFKVIGFGAKFYRGDFSLNFH